MSARNAHRAGPADDPCSSGPVADLSTIEGVDMKNDAQLKKDVPSSLWVVIAVSIIAAALLLTTTPASAPVSRVSNCSA